MKPKLLSMDDLLGMILPVELDAQINDPDRPEEIKKLKIRIFKTKDGIAITLKPIEEPKNERKVDQD